MTSRGHVILTEYPATVTKYTDDAEIIHQIKLASDIKEAYQAIETYTGASILISCEYTSTDKNRHQGVCEVTYEGHIIRYFQVQSFWDSVTDGPLLVFPLTTDADSNVYVLDRIENRVIILNSSFNLRRVMQLKDSLQYLRYSHETKQLIVGQYNAILKYCISIIKIQ